MESCTVDGTINDTDLVFLNEWVEAYDFMLGEQADRDKMFGGLDSQGCHYPIPPVIGFGEPRAVVEKRQVVHSHYFVANQNGSQSCETNYHIIFFPNEE